MLCNGNCLKTLERRNKVKSIMGGWVSVDTCEDANQFESLHDLFGCGEPLEKNVWEAQWPKRYRLLTNSNPNA